MKLIWKVAEAPIGRYRSFEKRQWPTAYYKSTGKPAVFLSCEDAYVPANAKTGNHAEIKIILCHHQHPEAGNSWVRLSLKRRANTLDEAKKLAEDFLAQHPEYAPKSVDI